MASNCCRRHWKLYPSLPQLLRPRQPNLPRRPSTLPIFTVQQPLRPHTNHQLPQFRPHPHRNLHNPLLPSHNPPPLLAPIFPHPHHNRNPHPPLRHRPPRPHLRRVHPPRPRHPQGLLPPHPSLRRRPLRRQARPRKVTGRDGARLLHFLGAGG